MRKSIPYLQLTSRSLALKSMPIASYLVEMWQL